MKDLRLPAAVTIPAAIGLVGVLWLLRRKTGSGDGKKTTHKDVLEEKEGASESNNLSEFDEQIENRQTASGLDPQWKTPESLDCDTGTSGLQLQSVCLPESSVCKVTLGLGKPGAASYKHFNEPHQCGEFKAKIEHCGQVKGGVSDSLCQNGQVNNSVPADLIQHVQTDSLALSSFTMSDWGVVTADAQIPLVDGLMGKSGETDVEGNDLSSSFVDEKSQSHRVAECGQGSGLMETDVKGKDLPSSVVDEKSQSYRVAECGQGGDLLPVSKIQDGEFGGLMSSDAAQDFKYNTPSGITQEGQCGSLSSTDSTNQCSSLMLFDAAGSGLCGRLTSSDSAHDGECGSLTSSNLTRDNQPDMQPLDQSSPLNVSKIQEEDGLVTADTQQDDHYYSLISSNGQQDSQYESLWSSYAQLESNCDSLMSTSAQQDDQFDSMMSSYNTQDSEFGSQASLDAAQHLEPRNASVAECDQGDSLTTSQKAFIEQQVVTAMGDGLEEACRQLLKSPVQSESAVKQVPTEMAATFDSSRSVSSAVAAGTEYRVQKFGGLDLKSVLVVDNMHGDDEDITDPTDGLHSEETAGAQSHMQIQEVLETKTTVHESSESRNTIYLESVTAEQPVDSELMESPATKHLVSTTSISLESANSESMESASSKSLVSARVEHLKPANLEPSQSAKAESPESVNTESLEPTNDETLESANTETLESANTETLESANTETLESADTEALDSANTESLESADTESLESANTESLESTNTESLESANTESLESANTEALESANIESLESANAEALESANSESLESANTESLESANTESLESANTEALESANIESLESANAEALESANSESLESANTDSLESANTEALESANSESLESANTEALESANSESLESANSASLESASSKSLVSASVEHLKPANLEPSQSAKAESPESANTESFEPANDETLESANTDILESANTEALESANTEASESASIDQVFDNANPTVVQERAQSVQKTLSTVQPCSNSSPPSGSLTHVQTASEDLRKGSPDRDLKQDDQRIKDLSKSNSSSATSKSDAQTDDTSVKTTQGKKSSADTHVQSLPAGTTRRSISWLPKASSSSVDSFGPDEIEALWGLESSMVNLDEELIFLDSDPVTVSVSSKVVMGSVVDLPTQHDVSAAASGARKDNILVAASSGSQSDTSCDNVSDPNVKEGALGKSISPVCDNNSEGSNDSGRGGSEHDMVCQGGEVPVQFNFCMPSDLCGQFIGKQGKNINYLKTRSGAHVTLTSNPFMPEYQICQIEGTQAEVDDALAMIRRKFPLHDYPHLTMDPVDMSVPLPLVPDSQVVYPEVMQLSLPEGVSVDVYVSAVVDAGQVFVQQPTHRSYMSLEKMNYFLNLVYSQDPNVPSVPLPIESGVICVCESEGFWYRAMIMSPVDENGEVQLKFVDYGGYITLPVTSLKQIRVDFMNLPFQAVECFMANITPNQGEKLFSDEATQALCDLTQGKLLQCQVVARTEYGIPYIHLYQVNPERNSAVLINRALVNRRLVRWIEIL